MQRKQVRVAFQPYGKSVLVPEGATVLEAATRAGITIETPCGGHGTCGKCRVRIPAGALEPSESDRKRLSPEELDAGVRLACQTAVNHDLTVEVPDSSVVQSEQQILAVYGEAGTEHPEPAVRKLYVEMPLPSREDPLQDLDRLRRVLGAFSVDVPLLRDIPKRFRENAFKGTAVLLDGKLIDFEADNTEQECYGLAFDIGTTTLVAMLLHLCTGEVQATASRANRQTAFGDDVLSRILHARDTSHGLDDLHGAVLTDVNEMIDELTARSRVPANRVYEASFGGNSTMQHLLTGIDPSALGQVPFAGVSGHALRLDAAGAGLAIHPRGMVYVMPTIGGHVGGDTVAGILATRLDEMVGPALFIDIGTNGEIVVCHEGRLLAASTAAGPAFEGARITHGMRAAAGAIEKVVFDDDVRYEAIGNVRPYGLCGSALIDAAAALLRAGIVMSEGLLLGPEHTPPGLPQALLKRLVETEEGFEFVLAWQDETSTGKPITLTQRDIRELQLATGAIRAGVSVLLRRAGLAPDDLKRVLIAGAFGNYIRCENAQRIGLLPPQVAQDHMTFAGNTCLAGARIAALSEAARDRAEELARRTQHVDLSLDPGFQTAFAEAMNFPAEES